MEKLLDESNNISSEILNNMSDEWKLILNEKNTDIKIKKLYSALIKEQIRRKTTEEITKQIKIYAEAIKEQTTKRISDLKELLNEQINFLEENIKNLEKESEINLKYYRKQLQKSNIELIKNKKIN